MPGLFGILSKKPDLSKERLKQIGLHMAESMQTVPWLKTEIWTDGSFCGGRVHLGVINPLPQPAISSNRRVAAWCDGALYPVGEYERATLYAGEIAALVEDEKALANSDGSFAIVCFDSENKVLSIANDRLGFRPLYFAETREMFAFAAEVKALLAILPKVPELDEIALRQFVGFDYMLGERTWWKGIKLIPPASLWKISAAEKRCTTYWTFDEIKRERQPEKEIVQRFRMAWSKAVKQYSLPGMMPLLLSGGLDSRLLLAELNFQGVDLTAITFGEANCLDLKIAQICAKQAGVRHTLVLLNSKNWWVGRENAIWQTDGLVNALHYHGAAAVEAMHIGNQYTMINSTGDTLFGGSKLHYTRNSDEWSEPSQLLREMYLENDIFSSEDVIGPSIPDCSRYLCGPSVDCFTISQRQRRFILAGPIYFSPYCEVFNPGIGLELLQLFLGRLTDAARTESRFYNQCLVEWYPEFFTAIPWQKTGRGLSEPKITRWFRDLSDVTLRKVNQCALNFGSKVPGLWRLTHTNSQFADYGKYVRESCIRKALSGQDLVVDEYFRGKISQSLAPEAFVDVRMLIAIVTMEVYFRRVHGLPALKLAVSN